MSIVRLPASILVAFITASAAHASPALAEAPDSLSQAAAPRFGDARQVVLQAGQGFQLQTSDGGLGNDKSTSYSISLPVGVFVSDNILVSLTPSFSSTSSRYEGTSGRSSSNSKSFAIAPSVSWNLPLDEKFSLLPTASLGIGRAWRTFRDGDDEAEQKETSYSASLSMPLLFHPGRHLFLGLGPLLTFSRAKEGNQRRTYVGFFPVMFTMGGWI